MARPRSAVAFLAGLLVAACIAAVAAELPIGEVTDETNFDAIGLDVDAPNGYIYAVNPNENNVYKINANTGEEFRMENLNGFLNRPGGVCYDQETRKLYVANFGDSSITTIDTTGQSPPSNKKYELADMGDIEYDIIANRLFVVDGNVIKTINSGGSISTFATLPIEGKIGSIAFNYFSNDLYATDTKGGRVFDVAAGGSVRLLVGEKGVFENKLQEPTGVEVDAYSGSIFVATKHAIYRGNFDYFDRKPTEFKLVAGHDSDAGHTNANGGHARFDSPRGLGLYRRSGILYVADSGRIRRVVVQGRITGLQVKFNHGDVKFENGRVSIKDGYEVDVTGENLGTGEAGDITKVFVVQGGQIIEQKEILSQSATQVIFIAKNVRSGEGDIVVQSRTYGYTAVHYGSNRVAVKEVAPVEIRPAFGGFPRGVDSKCWEGVPVPTAEDGSILLYQPAGHHAILAGASAYSWDFGAAASSLATSGNGERVLQICLPAPGKLALAATQVEDPTKNGAVSITIKRDVRFWPSIIAASLTALALISMVTSVVATFYGNRNGNELSVVHFAQFIAALVAFNVVLPRSVVAFHEGLSWSILHTPLPRASVLRDVVFGHIFSSAIPAPDAADACPYDILYTWTATAWVWGLVIVVAVFLAGIVLAFLRTIFAENVITADNGFWKCVYYGIPTVLFTFVLHSARVFTMPASWRYPAAIAGLVVPAAYVLLLCAWVYVFVGVQRVATFRTYTAPAGTPQVPLLTRAGFWFARKGGEGRVKAHGPAFKKYKGTLGAYNYLGGVELLKKLVQGIILGFVRPAHGQLIGMAITELLHILYLVAVRPYADPINTLVETITALVELAMVGLVALINSDYGCKMEAWGSWLWWLAAFWLFVLIVIQWRWQVLPYMADVSDSIVKAERGPPLLRGSSFKAKNVLVTTYSRRLVASVLGENIDDAARSESGYEPVGGPTSMS
eukprot:tig00000718_g3731.t1